MNYCPKHAYHNPDTCAPCRIEAQGKVCVEMAGWDLGMSPVPCVIVAAPTGIVYTNQAGGVWCAQPELEGYITEDAALRSWYALSDTSKLCDLWGVDDAARLLHELGASDFPLELLDVPAVTGADHGEAWIPVILADGRRGVFTYTNSD